VVQSDLDSHKVTWTEAFKSNSEPTTLEAVGNCWCYALVEVHDKDSEKNDARYQAEQAVREAATICPHPLDLLTLKVVSESHVRWATSVPILVFLGLSVLDLGPMYTTDVIRCQTASSLNALPRGGGIIIWYYSMARKVTVVIMESNGSLLH